MKYIIGKKTIPVVLAVALAVLTGCQNDDGNGAQQPTRIDIQPYMKAYDEARQPASTRAWDIPEDFYNYSSLGISWSDLTNSSISIYFTGGEDGKTVAADGQFVYEPVEGKWWSTFDIKEVGGGQYYLYGFIPSNRASSNITYRNGDYKYGAILTLNLPTVTTYDYSVTVGAKKGTSPTTTPDVTGPELGHFDYNLVGGEQNHVYLLFDHLYSAVQFKIKVDEKYNALRHIKLKQLRIVAYNGETLFKSRSTVTVGLASYLSDASPKPINSITFTPEGTDETLPEPLFDDEEGKLLTIEYQDCKGCFVPFGMINNLSLETTYDVYDTNGVKDPEDPTKYLIPDNLIRKDQKAVNKIDTSVLFGETLMRGKIYTIKLKVNPTYLYMMSEPDLDNPTIEVGS